MEYGKHPLPEVSYYTSSIEELIKIIISPPGTFLLPPAYYSYHRVGRCTHPL
jgi:hypothetical protein